MRILVTGASGYIGGRLVPRLLEAEHEVRCLVRSPEKLTRYPWYEDVEVVQGDVLDGTGVDIAMEGIDVAFYLIHSMDGDDADFAERDRRAANNFRTAAELGRLKRIIYLGGLGDSDELSKHLSSRQEVGQVLADGATPVSEFRAGVVIGSGSVSFEMLRYLTEVLPVMITPAWVRTRCQPIAVSDVLRILVDAVNETDMGHTVYEIGGPERMTYEDLMRVYAEVRGLRRRWIIPVPVLSPELSSHWVGLVTPLPTGVAKPLVESLRNEVIVADNSHAERVAQPLVPYREAVARALQQYEGEGIPTRWSDTDSYRSPAQPLSTDPEWAGGTTLVDEQVVTTTAPPEDVFWAFSRIGGEFGYYTMNWAWSIRGFIDALFGGAGLSRGRRHPEEIFSGEALDFWRVVDVQPGRRLQLYAQMKLPGEAWLSFAAEPSGSETTFTQTAIFLPRGLIGRLYWYVLIPFHLAIFARMARRMVAAAEGRGGG